VCRIEKWPAFQIPSFFKSFLNLEPLRLGIRSLSINSILFWFLSRIYIFQLWGRRNKTLGRRGEKERFFTQDEKKVSLLTHKYINRGEYLLLICIWMEGREGKVSARALDLQPAGRLQGYGRNVRREAPKLQLRESANTFISTAVI
jgi:hypothetical protein